jgi:hypothetical protein
MNVKCIYIAYGGGLEYTADEWNIPHSIIGTNSKGAHRRHPYCYIRSGYCQRTQATSSPSYAMANVISTVPSLHTTVWGVKRVNASMVSRGGGIASHHPQQANHLPND